MHYGDISKNSISHHFQSDHENHGNILTMIQMIITNILEVYVYCSRLRHRQCDRSKQGQGIKFNVKAWLWHASLLIYVGSNQCWLTIYCSSDIFLQRLQRAQLKWLCHFLHLPSLLCGTKPLYAKHRSLFLTLHSVTFPNGTTQIPLSLSPTSPFDLFLDTFLSQRFFFRALNGNNGLR